MLQALKFKCKWNCKRVLKGEKDITVTVQYSEVMFHIFVRAFDKHRELHKTYLRAPWTRGFLRNLEKRLVTSSRSAARSVNASTFVSHITSLSLCNLCPGILILSSSAGIFFFFFLWNKISILAILVIFSYAKKAITEH